ncbi:MAG: hypothetical protein AABY14_04660, partial [Nanoarchaeota archaeon]
YTTHTDIYKVKLIVSKFLSKINIERNASKTIVLIGEDTEVKTKIKNNSTILVKNLLIKEPLPKDELSFIGINSNSDCHAYSDSLLIEGNLEPMQEKLCAYTLQALRPTTYTSVLSISYYNGKDTINTTTSQITINVPKNPLSAEINISKNEISLNEEFITFITLTNTDTLKGINILSIEFEIPDGLELVTLPQKLKLDYRKLSWSGILEPSESKTFAVELKLTKYQQYKLTTNIAYLTNDKRYEDKVTKNINEIIENSIEKEENILTNKSQIINITEIKQSNISIETKLPVNLSNNSTKTINNSNNKLEIKEEHVNIEPLKIPIAIAIPIIFIIITILLITITIIRKMRKKKRENKDPSPTSHKSSPRTFVGEYKKEKPNKNLDELIKTGEDTKTETDNKPEPKTTILKDTNKLKGKKEKEIKGTKFRF